MTDSGSIGSHTAQCAALIAPYAGGQHGEFSLSFVLLIVKHYTRSCERSFDRCTDGVLTLLI